MQSTISMYHILQNFTVNQCYFTAVTYHDNTIFIFITVIVRLLQLPHSTIFVLYPDPTLCEITHEIGIDNF